MSGKVKFHAAYNRWLNDVREIAGYLWQRGWAEANGGNFSADVSEMIEQNNAGDDLPLRQLPRAYPALAGKYYFVTGTGKRFRDLAADPAANAAIAHLNEAGDGYRLVWGGNDNPDFRPTSELVSHLQMHEVLQKRAAADCVVLHTHPHELIALTHLPQYLDQTVLNRALWAMLPEVVILIPRGIGLIPYIRTGTQELATATANALQNGHRVTLWEKHGCLATGRDIVEAFDLIDTANKAAQILLTCLRTGQAPQGLSEEQIKDLVDAFKLPTKW
ncbi:MAG TPA: rhamnulose-1-phosphate aldolase [bacterium]|nr:rhamnulose-1-phosphate aldolase [bacterium]